MKVGLGLGFRVSIVIFALISMDSFFISLAVVAIVDFDRSESMSISPRNLTGGHHDTTG